MNFTFLFLIGGPGMVYSLPGFYCLEGVNVSKFTYMNETIVWPDGEFTIQDVFTVNAAMPQSAVREELAAAIEARRVVQTRKGTHRIKGKFKAVKEPAAKV
jgi:hypothetical protein